MRDQQQQHQDGISGLTLTTVLVGTLAVFSVIHPVLASGRGEKGAKKTSEKKNDDPFAESGSQVRRRDPFIVPSRVIRREVPRKVVMVPQPVLTPGGDLRLSEYRSRVREDARIGRPAPSALSPYLIEELTVNGIFKTSAGYGAFVIEGVSSKKMTLFARQGMKTYDGVIKEISPTGVRFVKNIRFDNGDLRQTEIFLPLSGRPTSSAPKSAAPPESGQPAKAAKETADKASPDKAGEGKGSGNGGGEKSPN